MTKLWMTKGLPASGKTTSARTLELLGVLRVNKDDLRSMLFENWKPQKEKVVLKARDAIIETALSSGRYVVVDDTNLVPKHEERLRQLAREHKAEFEIIDLTDVPLAVCLERNAQRTGKARVPDHVIRQMWVDHIRGPITYDESLPRAVIVDIDGTLAHMNGRGPYEWGRVGEDGLDERVSEVVSALAEKYYIIYLSGRDEVSHDQTVEWLERHDLYHFAMGLHMRPHGDMRKDAVVKRELFEQHIKPHYYPYLVLDDREQVVRMWRDDLGLTVWQVADGNF